MIIIGETIKNAILGKLLELFPNVSVYKEQMTTPDFPHFFILQLNTSSVEDRKDKYFITYLMNIRYREVADVATEAKIEQKLDDIGNELIINFTDVQIGEKPYKIREAYYEKIDGVLHFTCKIKIQVEKEKIQETPMRVIDININMKGE